MTSAGCDIKIDRQLCGSQLSLRQVVDFDDLGVTHTRTLCALHQARYFDARYVREPAFVQTLSFRHVPVE